MCKYSTIHNKCFTYLQRYVFCKAKMTSCGVKGTGGWGKVIREWVGVVGWLLKSAWNVILDVDKVHKMIDSLSFNQHLKA